MKKLFPLIWIIFGALLIYFLFFNRNKDGPEQPKQAAIILKKHSEEFNKSTESVVNAYLDIKNAFVNADTTAAKSAARNFIMLLDGLPIDELKKDTATIFETVQGNIADIKSNATSLLQQTDITEMRKDFSMVTEMMYPSFFTAINYEGPTLYLENCPMAFDDSVAANWISNSTEIVNPYLGKNHPTYKGGMLHCGEVKDSVVAR
ncbi:MAG: DUF3347 domain-containing protein [Ferruginibacter sp.]